MDIFYSGSSKACLVCSDKLRQALMMVDSIRSTLCALLFRFAIFLVRSAATETASSNKLTTADPQTCFRPELYGSARESAPALGLAIRLIVGAAASLQQPTPTKIQAPVVHHIGHPPLVFLYLPLCMHFGAVPARDTAATRAVSGASGAVLLQGPHSMV